MEKMHPAPRPPGSASLDRPSYNDLQVLLFELTKAGDIGRLQQTALFLVERDRPAIAATLLAVKMGSLQMVEILTQFSEYPRYDDPPWNMDIVPMYQAVARSDNVEIFRWFLGHMCRVKSIHSYAVLTSEVLANSSPDVYAEWENFLFDPARRLKVKDRHPLDVDDPPHEGYRVGQFREASTLIPHYNKRSVMFSQSAFKAVKNNAFLEARLVQTWHRLIDILGGGGLNPLFLGWSLTQLGKSLNCSIALATELLRLGAPIDFPRGAASRIVNPSFSSDRSKPAAADGSSVRRRRPNRKKYRGMTALYSASRSTSEQAAQFIRFLLEKGADPEYGWSDKKPAQEKAAPLMHKWLGETWEELVERTKHARQKKPQEEELEHGEDQINESDDSDEESAEDSPEDGRAQGGTKRRKLNGGSDEDE
jgi:hypothetical protein